MARVYLRCYSGREIDDLPPVCMACGAPATVRMSKQFSWQPTWVPVLILAGLLPYLIVSLVLTKRQRVATPFCDRHANYWWLFPTLLALSGFGIFGVGGIIFIAILNLGPNGPRNNDMLPGLVCFGTVGVFFVWLIVVSVINQMRIRPNEITDRHIELAKVSDAFADAVEEEAMRERREFGREFDDEPRRRFRDDRPRRPRDDDERYYGEDEHYERG
jgi:hypothetical protein